MKVLADAKLVLADVYTYSSRGKQITHYRLNRSPIVIVQERTQLESFKALAFATVIAAGAGIAYYFAQGTLLASKAANAAASAPADAQMMLYAAEETSLAADSAPVAMKAAAPIAETTIQTAPSAPSFLPAFLIGVAAVLAIGTIIILVQNWRRKKTP
jgi:hypothetical protein